jgi:hypothetical protein
LLLPLVLLASCGGGGGEGGTAATSTATTTAVATPGPSAGQLPEGFPTDFPIYENAAITAASRIGSAEGDIYAVEMETTDDLEAVGRFYEARLAETPWEVTNVVPIAEENTIVLEFARGGEGQAGTLAIREEQTDGQKTIIAISLPAPAATVTATPSPGP